MIQAKINFRTRPNPNISAQELHERWISGLSSGNTRWTSLQFKGVKALDFKGNVCADNFVEATNEDVNLQLFYELRNENGMAVKEDMAAFDDFVLMSFKKAGDFADFCQSEIRTYVSLFDNYNVKGTADSVFYSKDHNLKVDEHFRTGLSIDGRDTVWKFRPVNFFDRELTRRAFNMTPERLVDTVRPVFATAEVFHDGALLILEDAAASGETLDQLDRDTRHLLGDNMR